MSNDCTGFSQWKMDIWLNLMHEKLDCRPEDWWYSKQWLNFHVWNTGTSTSNSTSIEEVASFFGSHFELVPAVRRGTFRMCLGIPALRRAAAWDALRTCQFWGWLWDDCGTFPHNAAVGISQSQKQMSGDFAYTRKFLFVAIFVGQKKIQFITKPGGDFSCCGWRIISRGVSRIKFRHRSCGAKKSQPENYH